MAGEVTTEFRVINMWGRPSISGVYSTAVLGADAHLAALHVQRCRGGVVEARTVTTSEWAQVHKINTSEERSEKP
jgi:hypothetical protein